MPLPFQPERPPIELRFWSDGMIPHFSRDEVPA